LAFVIPWMAGKRIATTITKTRRLRVLHPTFLTIDHYLTGMGMIV
jgi:hypothetical protein